MKFCRQCGTPLPLGPAPGASPVSAPAFAPPALAPPAAAVPLAPPTAPTAGPGYGAHAYGTPAAPPPGFVPAAGYAAAAPAAPAVATSSGSQVTCPRCRGATPIGFAFCQQCGFQLPPLDGHGATLAAPPPTTSPTGPGRNAVVAWGHAVAVNRDGSDGERYPLAAEFVVVGRAGADIAFDGDRFLAGAHARLERRGDEVRVVPQDTLNGVFRKLDAPVALDSGAVILVGREVLRFELVDADERQSEPLIRHGVALFGSPPREPWGRISQILPSGGIRDIRHLVGAEAILGREEGDIVFRDDAFMSRRHASLTWDGRRATLADLNSSNGTFVRLTAPTVVRHGDQVRMGDQLFRLDLGR